MSRQAHLRSWLTALATFGSAAEQKLQKRKQTQFRLKKLKKQGLEVSISVFYGAKMIKRVEFTRKRSNF